MILENVKRQDLYKKPKKQNGFIKALMSVVAYCYKGTQKIKYTYERMDHPDFEEPHLILSNHMTMMDFCFCCSKNRLKRKFNYIIAIDAVLESDFFFNLQEPIMTSYGAVIKRKFTNDRRLIKNIKYSVETLKQDVLLYPEARFSLEGRLSTLPESLGKLIKLFNLPVETLTMHGNYLRRPQWHKKKVRGKFPLEYHVKGLLTREEVNRLTPEEIVNKISEALYYNEHEYQLENNIHITSKNRADGIHRILYQCKNCGTEFSMHSKGTKLWCDHCHSEWEYTELGQLIPTDNPKESINVCDWFDWERLNVRKQIQEGTYYFEDDVNVFALPNVNKWIKLNGIGHLTHTIDGGFHLTGKFEEGDLDVIRKPAEMYSCHIEYQYRKFGDCLDISTDNDTFFCNPVNHHNVLTKFHFAVEEIYQHHCQNRK